MKPFRIALLLALAPSLPVVSYAETAPEATRLFIVHFATGPAWDSALPPPAQKHFKEHSANLARLRREGSLLIGARYADKGMILLRAPDETAVRTALAADPSLEAGVFQVTVDEFHPFFHGSTLPEIERSSAERKAVPLP